MSKVVEFTDYELDGIDTDDYPDFCDAFICGATALLEDGTMREATEEELDELNNDGDLVYEHVTNWIF